MAFTLDADRPLDDAVQQAIGKQWRRVTAGLAGEETTHETRKALKRVRSLAALLAPVHGKRATRKLDRDLRDLGRSLAGARDREVFIATWRTLGAETRLPADAIASGEASLTTWSAGQRTVREIDVARTARRIGRRLQKVDAEGLGFADLIPGARATYREARRAFADARAADTSDAYHDWRKAVQRHFRHMTLLDALWPDAMGARAALARQLSHTIGEEHDLALLAQWLATKELPTEVVKVAPRLQRQIDKRCADLRRQARREGRRLFADTHKAFDRQLSVYAATMPRAAPGVAVIAPSRVVLKVVA